LAKKGIYKQKKSGKYRYFDGKSWIGQRYSTVEQAKKAYPKASVFDEEEIKARKLDKEFTNMIHVSKEDIIKREPAVKPKKWLIVLIVVALIAGLVGAGFWGYTYYKEVTKETSKPKSESSTEINLPSKMGGIDSTKINNDGSSALPNKYLDGDFTTQEVGEGNTQGVVDDINSMVIKGYCKNLDNKYPTMTYVSCPVSKLPDTKYQVGYQGKDEKHDYIRINGGYDADNAGGFVIVLNSNLDPLAYSYVGKPVND
jgi:hypothetical protein